MQLMIAPAICNTICFALSIHCACACGLAILLNLLAVTRWLVLVGDDAVLVRNSAPEPVRAHMLSTLQAERNVWEEPCTRSTLMSRALCNCTVCMPCSFILNVKKMPPSSSHKSVKTRAIITPDMAGYCVARKAHPLDGYSACLRQEKDNKDERNCLPCSKEDEHAILHGAHHHQEHLQA